MQRYTQTLAGITVTIDVPDGTPEPLVTMRFKPETAEGFEAALAGAGGLAAGVIEQDHMSFAFGREDNVPRVLLYAPAEEPRPEPVQMPFMGALRRRQHSARERFMAPQEAS